MAVTSIYVLTMNFINSICSLKPFIFIASLLFLTYDLKEPYKEEFSYVAGSPNGPEMWGSLNSTWTLCGTGQHQSPVDIQTPVALPSHRSSMVKYYRPAEGTISNRGHAIEVEWRGGDAGGIMVNDSEYEVEQCHWHIPSEHTINGQRFEMELHIVHANSHGNRAVIAVLYEFGRPDPFLTRLTPFLGSIAKPYQEAAVGVIDPTTITFDTTSYYSYNGSLTTPPCSQNVTWTIINDIKTVSREQVSALRKAVHDESVGNARPIQALNGRSVYLYQASHVHQNYLPY